MPDPLNVYDFERIDRILMNPTRYDKALLLDAANQLRVEVERQREVIADLDTEWGLMPDHADPDCTRSTGTGEYGRQEARINQQMYHHVTQRLIGKWRVVED